ncbi:MAG: hypothetical protein ACKVJG_10275 [Candidatus Latescibacterota bacterium]|jgi:hypothetical protein
MTWETRERGSRYYTRTRRTNGRRIREYIGGGVAGELAAQADEDARQERRRQRAAWRVEQEQVLAHEEPTSTMLAICEVVMRSELEPLGYYRRRGEWRHRDMRSAVKNGDID